MPKRPQLPVAWLVKPNDRVVPFFEEHEIPLGRVLTDRGTEFCGNPEAHEYELYLWSNTSTTRAPR